MKKQISCCLEVSLLILMDRFDIQDRSPTTPGIFFPAPVCLTPFLSNLPIEYLRM